MSIEKDWKSRGKENSPEKTVENIKKLFEKNGIETEYTFEQVELEKCYSCRLSIKNVGCEGIGSNGKGMNKELCEASAFGELIERLSNQMLNVMKRNNDPKYYELYNTDNPLYSPWEKNQPKIMEHLIEKLAASVKTPLFMKTPRDFVRELLEKNAPAQLNGRYPTKSFYSLKDKKVVFIPTILDLFVGSNGMAAGNTLEEALVEGISEILERYAQMQIYDGGIIPPLIPWKVIEQYPEIVDVIRRIEESGNYYVRILDCSLGKGLPVVCGVVFERNSGKFGMKFGAHPNMNVALERIFTEAMQGARLKQFVTNCTANFSASANTRKKDRWNCIKSGIGASPSELLMDDSTYDFVPWKDCSKKNNRELVLELTGLMEIIGGDIYVRDASHMGFPVVQIYAEGITEILPVDIVTLKEERLKSEVNEIFEHIESVTLEELKKIATLCVAKSGSIMENTLTYIANTRYGVKAPGHPFQSDFLRIMCLTDLGLWKEAATYQKNIEMNLSFADDETASFLRAVMLYIEGIAANKSKKQVESVIKLLCPSHVDKIISIFCEPGKAVSKLYAGYSKMEYGKEGTHTYPEIHEFYAKLMRIEMENPVDYTQITDIFMN